MIKDDDSKFFINEGGSKMAKKHHKNCCSAIRSEIDQSKGKLSIQKLNKLEKESNKDTMSYIPGGEFLMGGSDDEGFKEDGEQPIRKIKVPPFYIDKTTVTNRQFLQFVKETGYTTEAEQYGWSFVFSSFVSPSAQHKIIQTVESTPWWVAMQGAYWKKPEGIHSHIKNRLDHPVVHISWNDAMAFCEWSGKRLPTEAEWEFAARGGLIQKKYPWGDELKPNGQHHCNIWQGQFPLVNTNEDGYIGTAPAKSFPPNGYNLYNVSGNVWEWCSDWFSMDTYLKMKNKNNPLGPKNGTTKVMRGGSYLCHKSYCNRYRVAARSSNTPDSSSGNIGFRCVADC